MRRVMRLAVIALMMAGWTGLARAQQNPTVDTWQFQITPYFWYTGLHGQVGVGPLQTNVALSASDVIDALKFGLMAKFEAQKGPWVTGIDAIFVNLGDSRVFAIRGDTGNFELNEREWIVQPMGGYTLGDKTWGVDALIGLRYWNTRTTLDVDPATRRPSQRREVSRQWVDALGGLRARGSIPVAHVRVVLGGDAGRGGSKATWQYYGGANIDVAFNWSLGLTYRLLAIDYQRDNFLDNTRMRGPVFEATFRW